MFTIYCHTNRVNGKRYVGQTRKTMEIRWRRHLTDARAGAQWVFQRAIRKYGPEAFDHDVLEECLTLEAANAAEQRWIAHFNSTDPALGYNTDAGGNVRNTHPDSRAKLSASSRAWRASLTEEQKRAIAERHSEAMKARLMSMSDEERRSIMSAAMSISTEARRLAQQRYTESLTDEENLARTEAARKSLTAEVIKRRNASIKAACAAKTPEQRSDAIRRGHETRKRMKALAGSA